MPCNLHHSVHKNGMKTEDQALEGASIAAVHGVGAHVAFALFVKALSPACVHFVCCQCAAESNFNYALACLGIKETITATRRFD